MRVTPNVRCIMSAVQGDGFRVIFHDPICEWQWQFCNYILLALLPVSDDTCELEWTVLRAISSGELTAVVIDEAGWPVAFCR